MSSSSEQGNENGQRLTSVSKKSDKVSTRELKETLLELDPKESEDDLYYRTEILDRLNEIIQDWILEMTLAKRIPQDEVNMIGGKIYKFGSYRLGVHSKGDAIDVLCVAPRHIDRIEFFTSFYEKLKNCSDVTELRAVENAHVPVLKICFGGIEINLLFACLPYESIPENLDLRKDVVLKNLHVHCVRSLSSYRVTDELLRLVPADDVFITALLAIRLWAKRYGIYSNRLGYLGGVSWAMLVVKICQLYPNAVASTIVHKFFQVFSTWEWPKPVILEEIVEPPNLDFPVWNPKKNHADRSHLMPIITPCYPQQNSTYNVTKSARTIICRALADGFRISEEILAGRVKWSLLFERPNFFHKYKHFLLVIATSATEEDQLNWCGFVESKLRQLVGMLERESLIELVHVNSEILKLKELVGENGREVPNSVWVVGLEFCRIASASIDLTGDIIEFTLDVMRHARSVKIFKEMMKIEVKYVKRRDLKTYLNEDILKRDRPAPAIMASISENNATNTSGKHTHDETPAASTADAYHHNTEVKKARG